MGTRSFYDVPIVFWSLFPLLIHTVTCLGTNGFHIKLIPRYSIDLALFPKNFSQQEKHNRFADAINSTKQGIKALQSLVWNYEYFYATKVAIGAPPYYFALLLVDTGSNETWVQGEGCKECFKLKSGNFKYKESRTYTMVSCDHSLCNPRICIKVVCQYSLKYADGDYFKGYLSFDTFTFRMRDGVNVEYRNVIFGVGMKNSNKPFMRKKNIIVGIIGLGRGPRSILRQLEHDTHLRFPYCLYDLTN
ncbi:hypothetical protein SO802_018567 [Lithocarpus litseifolius]|uniref:Peptidase A1 domain-containing protein n=1 Tax=Lithocarpus litseifolius TaxID=425828 RepID=A0AAW2CLB4_9ROSI